MNDKRWLVGSCFAAVLSLVGACGGGDGVSCGTFAACGGDLVGTWTLEATCGADDLAPPEICPTATVTSNVTQSGTVSFGADNVYTENITSSGSGTVTFPASCLSEFQITSCDQLSSAEDGVTCTGNPSSSCACNVTIDETSNNTGTYTTSGNTVTTTTGDGTTVIEYCVDGSTMKARQQGDTIFIVFSK